MAFSRESHLHRSNKSTCPHTERAWCTTVLYSSFSLSLSPRATDLRCYKASANTSAIYDFSSLVMRLALLLQWKIHGRWLTRISRARGAHFTFPERALSLSIYIYLYTQHRSSSLYSNAPLLSIPLFAFFHAPESMYPFFLLLIWAAQATRYIPRKNCIYYKHKCLVFK